MDFTNMAQNFQNILQYGFPIMIVGLLSVLLVTGIIILAVMLLSYLCKPDANLARGLKALFSGKNSAQ